MNPMRLPQGVEEELEFLEEEGMFDNFDGRAARPAGAAQGWANGGDGNGADDGDDPDMRQLAARLLARRRGAGAEAREETPRPEPRQPWGTSFTRRVGAAEVRRRAAPPSEPY